MRCTLQCWQPPHAYDYIISSCILFLLYLCRLLREPVGVAAFLCSTQADSPKASCLLLTWAPLFHPLEGQTLGLPLSRAAGPLYTTEAVCSLPAPSFYLFGVFSFQPPLSVLNTTAYIFGHVWKLRILWFCCHVEEKEGFERNPGS